MKKVVALRLRQKSREHPKKKNVPLNKKINDKKILGHFLKKINQ
jgi:hypothetical protein